MNIGDALPGIVQIVKHDAQQRLQQAAFDVGNFAGNGLRGTVFTAQKQFYKAEDQIGIEIENRRLVVRLQADVSHAGGRGDAFEEFAVGHLLGADEVNDSVRAQISGKTGSTASGEVFVDHLQRLKLALRNSIELAEIEGFDFMHLIGGGRFAEGGIDFLLGKCATH
jgi:hypothetical protein